MNRHILFLFMFCLLPAGLVQAEEDRADWDQEEAVEQVKNVLEVEAKNSGTFPWNEIDWVTDEQKAIDSARKQNKPIFLFFFVDKGGPEEAPG